MAHQLPPTPTTKPWHGLTRPNQDALSFRPAVWWDAQPTKAQRRAKKAQREATMAAMMARHAQR